MTTGDGQAEALRLFRTADYREIPPFTDGAFTRHWMEKSLDRERQRRDASRCCRDRQRTAQAWTVGCWQCRGAAGRSAPAGLDSAALPVAEQTGRACAVTGIGITEAPS
jgi:hypothetical protein